MNLILFKEPEESFYYYNSLKKYNNLKRIEGSRNLTYEEFSKLLVSIEMTLNCRPLVPLSNDFDDINAFTPGHFLIDGGYSSIPAPVTTNQNLNLITHWNLVRAMQQRNKWTTRRENIKIGELVLILDPSLLQDNGKWPIGRVINTHPGTDGLTRVATVKTATGEYVRPIVKLASLPVFFELSKDPPQAIITKVKNTMDMVGRQQTSIT